MYLLVMVDGTLDSLLVLIANVQTPKGGLVLEHLQVAMGVRHEGPTVLHLISNSKLNGFKRSKTRTLIIIH